MLIFSVSFPAVRVILSHRGPCHFTICACHPFSPGAMQLLDLCVSSFRARGHATSRFVRAIRSRQGPCNFSICVCRPCPPRAMQYSMYRTKCMYMLAMCDDRR